jgi:hypothetical protein
VTVRTSGDEVGLFVYAVVEANHDLPDGLAGVDGSSLWLVPSGAVAAVVGEVALDRPPGRRADLAAYAEVMEALLPGGPVAPFRFGCVLPDEDAVAEQLLAPREAELTVMLDQVRGQVQYNLRADYVEETALAEIVQADPEIRQLRARTSEAPEGSRMGERIRLGELVARAWERLARVDADHLLDEVSPTLTAHAVRREPGPATALDAALLVDVARSQELEDSLERLAQESDGRLRLRLVGPLVPYDFVGAS